METRMTAEQILIVTRLYTLHDMLIRGDYGLIELMPDNELVKALGEAIEIVKVTPP